MDKLFNNHWFLRFVSLGIAVMLYAMVNMNNVSNQPGALPGTDESTYTVNDVEIQAYYDEERYDVVRIESIVDVKLSGPQTSIMLFQLSRPSYEVFVDLEGLGPGEHNVQIQHRNFPADLDVSLTPRFTSVRIEELKTEAYSVEAELVNEDEAKEGYTFGGPKVKPSEISVEATPSMHDQIDTVKALVDVSGADARVETSAEVIAVDAEGNELDVPIEPKTVEVEVPVTEPFKKVPINLLREGNLPDNLSIESLNMEPSEVTIFGPKESIKEINTIEAALDLSKIKEDGTIELELSPPEGANKVQPSKVKVDIEIGEKSGTVLEDVPIEVVNVPEAYTVSIEEPEQGEADVTVSGTETVLQDINEGNITLVADWNDRKGSQEEEQNEDFTESKLALPVTASGPPDVSMEPEIDTVQVEWTKNNATPSSGAETAQ